MPTYVLGSRNFLGTREAQFAGRISDVTRGARRLAAGAPREAWLNYAGGAEKPKGVIWYSLQSKAASVPDGAVGVGARRWGRSAAEQKFPASSVRSHSSGSSPAVSDTNTTTTK